LHLNLTFFLDFFLRVFGLCFAADCPSHVCLDVHLYSMLIETCSIAIWNPNKVAMVMAIGVWGINAVFLIEGRSLPLPSTAGYAEYIYVVS
jgi:hypothetical protein